MDLATQCRANPSKNHPHIASAKADFESVADVGKPKTIAAVGAMTPVANVAAASVFSHVAVSLMRSL
jgi:hypothetical protein